MSAHDLLIRLQADGFTVQAHGKYLEVMPADQLTDELLSALRANKSELLAELRWEARRDKVLSLLAANPQAMRAICADTDSDPQHVILTLAIRHVATCELLIPKAKYDAWQLMALVDAVTNQAH